LPPVWFCDFPNLEQALCRRVRKDGPTEMCLAIPVKVLRIEGQSAEVELGGNLTTADLSLLEEVKVGDYVILHAGIAIQKYDREEAEQTLELIRQIAGGETA